MSRVCRRWTDDEVQHLRDLFAAGLSTIDMARQLGRPWQSVFAKANRIGLRFVERRHGDVLVSRRFWEKVAIGPWPCWIWTGATSGGGYGTFCIGRLGQDRRGVPAHRFAWEATHGAIEDESWVLHRCDNRVCVRPDHLFLGTRDQNMADMVAKGRSTPGEKNPRARLTPAQADAIKRLYDGGGLRMQDIAECAGVSATTVARVISGESWGRR